MKNLTDMTIEELTAMKYALIKYFEDTRDSAYEDFSSKSNEEKVQILAEMKIELEMINGLIRNVEEAESEWKKAHTINWRNKLRQSKTI